MTAAKIQKTESDKELLHTWRDRSRWGTGKGKGRGGEGKGKRRGGEVKCRHPSHTSSPLSMRIDLENNFNSIYVVSGQKIVDDKYVPID